MDLNKIPAEYDYLLIKNQKDLLEFRIKSMIYGISTKVMLKPNNKNTLRIIIKKGLYFCKLLFFIF